MTYGQNQLRDYSSLFSRSEAQAWLRNDFASIHHKLERYDKRWKNSKATYWDYIKHVYGVIERNYQNEYIYKNAFLNEWLIKEIGTTESKVFSEFRVGKSIADLVMFNGKSKAFEIKTEFDSDARLELQLENYRKAFNEIYLIIPEQKIESYCNIHHSIGLITFHYDQPQLFTRVRKAAFNSKVDPETIMHVLHTSEYKSIVKSHYGKLPEMTSFNQFKKCSELIMEMPNEVLNRFFISAMKKRNQDKILSVRYYKELNQLSLALKLSQKDKENLIQNLKTPIGSKYVLSSFKSTSI